MNNNDQIRPIDIVKNLPKVIERLPAMGRAIKLSRNKADNDSFPKFFEQTVARYPGNVAIYFEDRTLTYLEFNRQANKIAHYLQSQGVGKGDVVGLFMHNRPEFLICWWACQNRRGNSPHQHSPKWQGLGTQPQHGRSHDVHRW